MGMYYICIYAYMLYTTICNINVIPYGKLNVTINR